jgi:hypothetical protein
MTLGYFLSQLHDNRTKQNKTPAAATAVSGDPVVFDSRQLLLLLRQWKRHWRLRVGGKRVLVAETPMLPTATACTATAPPPPLPPLEFWAVWSWHPATATCHHEPWRQLWMPVLFARGGGAGFICVGWRCWFSLHGVAVLVLFALGGCAGSLSTGWLCWFSLHEVAVLVLFAWGLHPDLWPTFDHSLLQYVVTVIK